MISPQKDLIAICTSHTAHVAILPHAAHLHGPETAPIRLKCFTVGSGIHVLTQPALVSAVWHPLGVAGHCLVTTTAEAVVRVWEFDLGNRWSFDRPRTTLDLKALANNLSPEDDGDDATGTAAAAALRMSANKVFSPDIAEMEVAATAFGADGSGGGGQQEPAVAAAAATTSAGSSQNPWAPMTLWIAMTEGDVYALCPLLPSRWTCTHALVSSLAETLDCNDDDNDDDEEQLGTKSDATAAAPAAMAEGECSAAVLAQRRAWIAGLLQRQQASLRNPPFRAGGGGSEEAVSFECVEPSGRIPELQGPLHLEVLPEDEGDGADFDGSSLTDIYPIAARSSAHELTYAEDVYDGAACALSWDIICLLTQSGRVHVMLDLDGVKGQWHVNEVSCYYYCLLLILLPLLPEACRSFLFFHPSNENRVFFLLPLLLGPTRRWYAPGAGSSSYTPHQL